MPHSVRPPVRFSITPRQAGRAALRLAGRSVLLRLLLFLGVLYGLWLHGRPWDLGWLRQDEAADLVENFLLAERVNLGDYTLIEAVEHRREGLWSAHGERERRFAADPALGYLTRYFRSGAFDGWSVAVSPAGQIYRVQREQLDDEPGVRLTRIEALHTVVVKLAEELAIPAYSLELLSDTMLFQPQRNDWRFTFAWPEALDPGGTVTVTLAGDQLAELHMQPAPPVHETLPRRVPGAHRVLGFALILGGVFLMMHYHRTPLALRTAGMWGAITFFLILLVRGLSFSQAVILMPADVPLAGYLARVGLSALITALQGALLIGLVVATGEALARDVFRRSNTLSRIAPGLLGWRTAWARGARWAFPAAALVLVYEVIALQHFGPVGLIGKVPGIMAGALSSPAPPLALVAEIGLDVVWEELVYRLWLLSLLMFWLRLPVLAIPLAAAAAAYFAGFDLAQLASVGGIFYLTWGILAGWLMLRSGIIAAMFMHLFVLLGYTALTVVWAGFSTLMGAAVVAAVLLIILVIARERHPSPARQLDILGPTA